ncbi:MAG TPA: prolipoprotein diacylglyceryl transferase [Planctomycetaceae bacterium]|jgi:phosphatidylglycerol:prolipoprotein diacylglycerol transferase
MRSILFSIPLDGQVDLGPLGKFPVFGVGLLLALWCLILVAYVALTARREGWKAISGVSLFVWGIVAVAIFKAAELPIKAIPVYGYGTMLFVGFVVSAMCASRRLRKEGVDGEIAWDAAMWIFICGILGARIFYIAEYHHRFFGPDPINGKARTAWETCVALINLPDGGLVLYGGLIFAPLAFYFYSRYRGVRPLAFADIAITSVFFGVMFGRLGCLLHGCCFGGVTNSVPWAITFPAHSVPFDALVVRGLIDENAACSLPLHPSQLYDATSALLLALLTWAYYPYRRWNGEVVALGWIAYPINRFMIEFLRSDEPGQFGTSLTIAQWVSMGLFASGLGFYLFLQKRSVGRQSLMLDARPALHPAPLQRPAASQAPAVR